LFEMGLAVKVSTKKDARQAHAVYIVPTQSAIRRRRKPRGISHQ
jgi:hypothetical protein